MNKKLLVSLGVFALVLNLLPVNFAFAEEGETIKTTEETSKHDLKSSEHEEKSSEHEDNSFEHEENLSKNAENTPVNPEILPEHDLNSSEQEEKTRGQDSETSEHKEKSYNPYSEDGKTMTFNSTIEMCSYLNSFYPEDNDHLKQYRQDCELLEKNPEYPVFSRIGFSITEGQTLILRNVKIEFDTGQTLIEVFPGGKVIIEGEDSYIAKKNGCAIIGYPGITGEGIEIRGGTFATTDGTTSPICYFDGEDMATGTLKKENLPKNEEAMSAFLSYIPEGYEFVDVADEGVERVLDETVIVSSWIFKAKPSWFRGFETWKVKVRKKQEEPIPDEQKEDEPVPTEPETPEEPKTEEETSVEKPTVSESLIVNPETSTGTENKAFELMLVLSCLVFFTSIKLISIEKR